MAAATATILRLGAWFPSSGDSFGAHSASPTGAIIDLNDGITFSLLDGSTGEGDGLDWGTPTPNVLSSGNVRTTGKAVKARRYTENRTVKATLFWGQGASYATWISAVHNIVGLCEGITAEKPAALQVQVTGASTPLYLDVLEAHVEVPYNEVLWQQLVETHVVVTLTCKPHFRGPITTLQNLVVNPGFEAPSGPGVTVFSDTFANTNAYTTQSGSAPIADKAFYSDAVQADVPIRYYRLDETSGTTAYDAAAGQNGTYTGGYTQGTTGALTGDSDTAVTLNGTTGYAALPLTSLPSGNSPWSLECWFNLGAYSSPLGIIAAWGNSSAKSNALLYVNSAGILFCDTASGPNVMTGSAVSLHAWHHAVGTYDGSNVRLYLDGALVGISGTTGPITVSTTYAAIGSWQAIPTGFCNGVLDEVAIYPTALATARVSAHYTAGTTTPAVATNSLLLAANSSVSFGSPNWTAINTWRLRFRWSSGATLYAYYHYTDANNYLRAEVTGTQIVLKHTIAGVATTLVTTTTGTTLAAGVHYWLSLTQFPAIIGFQSGDVPPMIQSVLSYDTNTAIGATLATSGPIATTNANTAMQGAPRLATVTGTIGLGIPNSATATQTVSLFGPGGWLLTSSGTGIASGAWEQQYVDLGFASNANLYTGGAVVSVGAARIDAAPTGTLTARWQAGDTSSPTRVLATSVQTPFSVVYSLTAYVKSSGLGSSGTIALTVSEYDISGNYLGAGAVTGGSVTGNQATYTKLTGTYTSSNSLSGFQPGITVTDATTGSANATVWIENMQCWSSQYGATMPYCDLFAAQAPTMLVVTGLKGDVPSPVTLLANTYLSSLASGQSLILAVGRRTHATRYMSLVGTPFGVTSGVGLWTPALDVTAYGGYTLAAAFGTGGVSNALFNAAYESSLPVGASGQGTYHFFTRAKTAASGANTAKVSLTTTVIESLFTNLTATSLQSAWNGIGQTPFSATNTWTLCDGGQVQLPPFPRAPLIGSGTSTGYQVRPAWADSSAATGTQNWHALVPVDGSIITATIVNNLATGLTNQFFAIGNDGCGTQAGYSATWTYTNNLGNGIQGFLGGMTGGSGTGTTPTIYINSTADSFLTLDPTLLGGVNQLTAVLTDSQGTVLPLYATLQYIPLYNYPI